MRLSRVPLPGPGFHWACVPPSIFLHSWASESLTSFLSNFSCSMWDLLCCGQGGADQGKLSLQVGGTEAKVTAREELEET